MKRVYLLLFAICISNFTIAQDDDDTSSNISFGIKAGYNAIQMKVVTESSDNVQREAGVYAGAFINIATSETFSVQPELLYSASRYNHNDNIDLLHLPVALKFTLGSNFTGFIGPEAQFLLGVGDLDDTFFNDFMFGFFFGASYEVAPNFSLEARPYFSFTRLLENDETNYRRLNTLQVGLAYQF